MPVEERYDLRKKTIEPLRGNVFVRLIDKERQEVSGLVIVNQEYDDRKTFCQAEVITVGPEVREVMPGDVVVVNGYAGKRIGEDNEGHVLRMMEQDECLALIEPVERSLHGEAA